MHGLLDDIGIYKWHLTAVDIAALYQAESAAHGSSVVKKSNNRHRRPFVDRGASPAGFWRNVKVSVPRSNVNMPAV